MQHLKGMEFPFNIRNTFSVFPLDALQIGGVCRSADIQSQPEILIDLLDSVHGSEVKKPLYKPE